MQPIVKSADPPKSTQIDPSPKLPKLRNPTEGDKPSDSSNWQRKDDDGDGEERQISERPQKHHVESLSAKSHCVRDGRQIKKNRNPLKLRGMFGNGTLSFAS